ncbi:hypothetical protein JG687_00013396, partial [Phytophthora cactorum]
WRVATCLNQPGARHFGRWTLKRPRASWRCARWTSTASPRRISSLQIRLTPPSRARARTAKVELHYRSCAND